MGTCLCCCRWFVRMTSLRKGNRKTKDILNRPITGFCTRCYEIVDWRKRFRKYKPLSQPATCEDCKKRNVRHAYHRLCHDCRRRRKCCARCKSTKNELVVEELTEAQRTALAARAQAIISTLPVRKRKAVVRLYDAGEITLSDIIKVAGGGAAGDHSDNDDDTGDADADADADGNADADADADASASTTTTTTTTT